MTIPAYLIAAELEKAIRRIEKLEAVLAPGNVVHVKSPEIEALDMAVENANQKQLDLLSVVGENANWGLGLGTVAEKDPKKVKFRG